VKLEAKAFGYAYAAIGEPVLRDLTLTLEPGSYWCLAGPNGSGKSTLLKLACGLLPHGVRAGELSWNGKPVPLWTRGDLARAVAFVPGALRAMFPASVGDFVLQGRYAHAAMWAQPSRVDREIAEEAIGRVGLERHAESPITEISAGELQLAMIARALAQEPKALLLDEATANLDLSHQGRVFKILGELNARGTTILLVSHDINLAAEFCPNVIWLKDGAVRAMGPTESTLNDDLIARMYGVAGKMQIGKNPFTKKPKLFWTGNAVAD
jgi:iron complex transport system ATP-binding protein